MTLAWGSDSKSFWPIKKICRMIEVELSPARLALESSSIFLVIVLTPCFLSHKAKNDQACVFDAGLAPD
jgi:hypothetical protein